MGQGGDGRVQKQEEGQEREQQVVAGRAEGHTGQGRAKASQQLQTGSLN